MTRIAAALFVAASAAAASADIVFTGSSYSQNFDTLALNGTNQAWSNDNTLPGWFLYRGPAINVAAINTYNAGTGTSNTGNFYSFGPAATAERALGGVGSGGTYFNSPSQGAVAGWIAFSITNGTADTMTDVTLGFDGEQWRDGGITSNSAVNAQTMVLEYGFGATFTGVTTWFAPGGNFDWSSPVFTSTATTGAGVDGNSAGLVAGRGGTISGLTWNPGDTLWVRWIENNDVNNDHGLAIDNFTFSATPTPGAAALLGLGVAAAGRRRRA